MELQSDYSRIQHLIQNTDDISELQFSEVDPDKNWSEKYTRRVDGSKQMGGANDTWTNNISNDTEQTFNNIFNKAKEYKQRVMDFDKQQQSGGKSYRNSQRTRADVMLSESSDPYMPHTHGGANRLKTHSTDVVKKKREMPEKLMKIVSLAKNLKATNKYPDLKFFELVKISKSVWDDAVKKTNSTDVATVYKTASDLIKNPENYVQSYKTNQKTATNRSHRVKRTYKKHRHHRMNWI